MCCPRRVSDGIDNVENKHDDNVGTNNTSHSPIREYLET